MTESTSQTASGSTTPQPEVLQPTSGKSRLAAGLLGIVLGYTGLHNFYLGKTSRGLTQLLITVLSLGLLSWVSEIWGIYEGIMYLFKSEGYTTDGNGQPLED